MATCCKCNCSRSAVHRGMCFALRDNCSSIPLCKLEVVACPSASSLCTTRYRIRYEQLDRSIFFMRLMNQLHPSPALASDTDTDAPPMQQSIYRWWCSDHKIKGGDEAESFHIYQVIAPLILSFFPLDWIVSPFLRYGLAHHWYERRQVCSLDRIFKHSPNCADN